MLVAFALFVAAVAIVTMVVRSRTAARKRLVREERQRRHAEQAGDWDRMMANRPPEPPAV